MTNDAAEQFILKGKDAEATGTLSEEGFVVKAGSLARKEILSSARDSVKLVRTRLQADGVLEEDGEQLRFNRDHLFDSPSAAAVMVLGINANGWVEWKHPDGRSLSHVKRVARASGEAMLSESKRQEILRRFEELRNEGKLYSRARLDKCYATFRERFGPSVLSGLDGEALLNFMHDHGNRDSLVYWLEFKNDHDFDTKQFGSIAGGSALKYRVFRRKETGLWQAGDEKNRPKDILVEEAIVAP